MGYNLRKYSVNFDVFKISPLKYLWYFFVYITCIRDLSTSEVEIISDCQVIRKTCDLSTSEVERTSIIQFSVLYFKCLPCLFF